MLGSFEPAFRVFDTGFSHVVQQRFLIRCSEGGGLEPVLSSPDNQPKHLSTGTSPVTTTARLHTDILVDLGRRRLGIFLLLGIGGPDQRHGQDQAGASRRLHHALESSAASPSSLTLSADRSCQAIPRNRNQTAPAGVRSSTSPHILVIATAAGRWFSARDYSSRATVRHAAGLYVFHGIFWSSRVGKIIRTDAAAPRSWKKGHFSSFTWSARECRHRCSASPSLDVEAPQTRRDDALLGGRSMITSYLTTTYINGPINNS